jgi:hypothetical protein
MRDQETKSFATQPVNGDSGAEKTDPVLVMDPATDAASVAGPKSHSQLRTEASGKHVKKARDDVKIARNLKAEQLGPRTGVVRLRIGDQAETFAG